MRNDAILIFDILNAIISLEKFTKKVSKKEFLKNEMMMSACAQKISVIGEASAKLSPSLKKQFSEVPWKEIIGMRNRLVHEYFGIDSIGLWLTIKNDIPEHKKLIRKIYKSLSITNN